MSSSFTILSNQKHFLNRSATDSLGDSLVHVRVNVCVFSAVLGMFRGPDYGKDES